MATKQIYRGFDIHPQGSMFVISKDGKTVSENGSPELFASEEKAMGWIDAERRKARQAIEAEGR